MSEIANALAVGRRLRVAILATDAARRSALREIVAAHGHDVVDAPDAADVVLAEGDSAAIDGRPLITLGGSDADHAGVLSRDADASQIDAALRAVAAGLIVRMTNAGTPGFGAMHEDNLQSLLTPREIEVLNAIGEGLTNKGIARRLNISLHTVKFHVESLFRKLGVRTRTEAVTKALERRRRGILEL